MCIIWSFLWSESCLFHHFPSKPTYPGDLLKTPHSQAKTLCQKQWCLAPYYLSPEGTKGDPPDFCSSPVWWAHTGPRIVHTCSVLFKCSFTCWSPCKVPVKSQLKQKPSTRSRCRHLLRIARKFALLSTRNCYPFWCRTQWIAGICMEEEGETDLPPSFFPQFPKQGNGLPSSCLHPGWVPVVGTLPSSVAWQEPNLIRVDVGFNLL